MGIDPISNVNANMMYAVNAVRLGANHLSEELVKKLKDLGIEGEWEGIGHCAIGYIDGEVPQAAKRKDGRVFWAE